MGNENSPIIGTAKDDTLDAVQDGDFTVYPEKGKDIVNVDGDGIKRINITIGEGNTTIRFGNDIENCKVEIDYIVPEKLNNPEEHEMEFLYGKDGDNLLIYAVDWERKGSRIIEYITVEDYFKEGREAIQEKLYFYDFVYGEFGQVSKELVAIEPEYLTWRPFYKEATNKGGELDTTDTEYRVLYNGGTGYDIMKSNSEKTVGDEIYTGSKGKTDIYTGKGSDYFHINGYSQSDIFINDSGAYDDLFISGVKHGDGWNIFFDVVNESYELDENEELIEAKNNLLILKDSNIQNWIKNNTTVGSIEIANWFETNANDGTAGAGYIERIRMADGIEGHLTDVDEHIAKVTERVKSCLAGTKYQTAMEALMDPKLDKNLKQELINCYTIESCPIELIYEEGLYYEEGDMDYVGVKKGEFYGSSGNDVFYSTKDSTIYGGKGNDKLYRGTYGGYLRDEEGEIIYDQYGNASWQNDIEAQDYKLYGQDGNDILEAGRNSVLDGGAGINVMTIDSASDALIINSKGNDYVHLIEEDLATMTYLKEGNDLVIQGSNGSTTLKDYFKSNGKTSVKGIIDYSANDTLLRGFYGENYESSGKTIADFYKDATALEITKAISELENKQTITELLTSEDAQIINDVIPKGVKFTGTAYNDKIDAQNSDKGLTLDGGNGNDEIDGTRYSDTIIGGNDNDEIRTGLGADTVTGGKGLNTIEYDNIFFVDGDKINLTKGEQLVLDFSTLEDAIFGYKVNGKDLDITVTAMAYDEETYNPIGLHSGTLKLLNYATKEIADSVKIRTSEFLDGVELKSMWLDEYSTLKNYTGSFLRDNVIGENYKLYKDKNKTIIQDDYTKKGLTFDTKDGDDMIIGSDYSDTIKGGNGNDTITGGSGNDIIYGGASTYIDEGNYSNNLYFNIGDGHDTIQMDPKGKDTIIFGEGITQDDIYYKIDGKDLILSYSDEDSIRIKNYMSTPADKISVDEVQFFNDSSFNISDRLMFTPNGEGYWEEDDEYYKLYEGTDGNDFIYVNNTKGYYDTVDSGAGNDTLQFNSKYADVFDMEGDDRYIINSLSNSAEIFDNAGTDTMVINAKKEDLNIVFNVFENGYGLEDLENYTPEFENFNEFYDLFIMSKKSLNDTIKMFTTGKEIPIQNVSVYDYFNQRGNYDEHGNPWNCKIETIQTKNATITYEDLNAVKEGIASWLATKDEYICAIQVLSSDNKADRDTLLAYYNSVWTDTPGVIPQ